MTWVSRRMQTMWQKRVVGRIVTKKDRGIVANARHLGGRFTWNGNNREELLCRKRAIRTAWVNGPLGQETHHLWLQSSWSCGVSSGDLCVARFGDEGDQLIAMQTHER